MKSLTRRDFIKLGTLAAIGVATTGMGFNQSIPNNDAALLRRTRRISGANGVPTLVLHPFEWATDLWQSPGGTAIGVLDKRSNTQAALAGGVPQGAGFFSYPDGATLPSGTLNFGSDIERILTLGERSGLLSVAGIITQSGDSILDTIRSSYLNPDNYDATGVTKCKPLRISQHQGVKLHLGGFGINGLVVQESFTPSHPAFTATLAVRFADYRYNRELPDTLAGAALTQWIKGFRVRGEASITEQQARDLNLIVLEKWTGSDMHKLYGRMGDDLLPALVPPEYLDGTKGRDSWRRPNTTLADTFVDTNGVLLENHTATGPDSGFSWTDVGGTDMEIDNNLVRNKTSTATYRTEGTLSSDNHFVQADVATVAEGVFGRIGARFAAAADTAYWGEHSSRTFQTYRLLKRVTGTDTALGTNSAADPGNGVLLNKLECNNSDLEFFSASVSRISLTDTAITGNIRAGLRPVNTSIAGDITYDNLKYEDQAVGVAYAYWM